MVQPLAERLPIPLVLSRIKASHLPSISPVARRLRLPPRNDLAEVYWLPWANRFACVTRTIASSSCGSPASCAVVCHRIRITSRLPNRVRWAAAQATSSPSRFAASITASFIARAMRQDGGGGSTSIRFQSRSGFGSRAGLMANCSRRSEASRRRSGGRQRITQLKMDQTRAVIPKPIRTGPFSPDDWQRRSRRA